MGAGWNWLQTITGDKHWYSAVPGFWQVKFSNVRLGASH